MRSNVNNEIRTLDAAAPANACHVETPNSIMGGAIKSVRATVQPINRNPDPFFFSSTFAAVP